MNLSNHEPEASAGGQDAVGLTEEQVTRLRAEFGPNELQREVRTPAWVLLAAQFKSPVIGLLAGACAISAALGEVLDAVAIGAIVVLNALVGFFQEYRAERAILALRSMTAPRARVVRDGRAAIVPAADVVPGDIIVLEAGDVVAADAELIAAHVLATNEASLTGESTPAASIVAGVHEGRGIFDNIRKTLVYLLAGNAAELALMLLAAVLGLPLPLLPLALLWINLATDGLPALTLVMDPADPEALRRPPRHPDEPLLGRAEWISIAWTAALQTTVVLAVYIWALEARGLTEARNLAFTTLVFGELFRAFAARHPTRLFWEVGALTNLRLLAVVLGSAVLQIAIHHLPATQELFQIASITLADCAASVMLGLIPVTVLELNKLARRALQARRGVTR